MIARRGILRVFAGLLAAPAIVRVASLMPISVSRPEFLITTIRPPFIYSGYDVRDVAAEDIFGAEYSWRHAANHVVIEGVQQLQHA